MEFGKSSIINKTERNSFSENKNIKSFFFNESKYNLTKNKRHLFSFSLRQITYPNRFYLDGIHKCAKTKLRNTCPKKVCNNLSTNDTMYLPHKLYVLSYNKYLNNLKFTPLKIFGLINPSIEICYERMTGYIFSTQIMASYLLPSSIIHLNNDFKQDIKGIRVSLEEKLFLNNSESLRQYIGFEFDLLSNQYKDIWSFGMKQPNKDTTKNFTNYLDTFRIIKKTYSLNLKLGCQIIVKRITFDFFAGLGLKYKDVSHFDRLNYLDEMELPRHPNIYYISNSEGKYWTLSIPLNVRIGWVF